MNQANIEVVLSHDKMSASLTLTKPLSGELTTINEIMLAIEAKGIIYGLSSKRVNTLLEQVNDALPGEEFSQEIAKGLPAKHGKNSTLKVLFKNPMEKVLVLQHTSGSLNSLSEQMIVDKGAHLATRIPPSNGRNGTNVTGETIAAVSGSWIDIALGENTELSSDNHNYILSSIAGQPKLANSSVSISEIYISEGVNVGTGNIDASGAVLVTGDVTENMEILAKGDITIIGYVESALIRTDGDIIITEGAMGKMNDEDCQLVAKGNIYIQHAQGLDICAEQNLYVTKQLAYSRVTCKGEITIGAIDLPMGNIFACKLNCYNTLRAGSIGAVSGGELSIDFSAGFKQLLAHINTIDELCELLTSKNTNHEIKLTSITSKNIPEYLQNKLHRLNSEIEKERVLVNWLQDTQKDLQQRRRKYENKVRIIANKELFPGVTIKLNEHIWLADKEHQRCQLTFSNGEWLHQALI